MQSYNYSSMIKKILSISMLIIGTIIGAGFSSGRELISFFGSGISLWVAVLCGVAIFLLCALFLYIGSKTGANNVSEVNVKLIGRFHFIPDSFLLVNSLIVLGGMLAGIDSLGSALLPISPVYSILMGILCIFVVTKGIKGLLNCNSIVVPIIIFALILISIWSIFKGNIGLNFDFKLSVLPTIAIYVSMNMMLASTVLTTMGRLSKKDILVSSTVAGGVIMLIVAGLILALNACDFRYEDMPVLAIAKAINPFVAVLIAIVIAVSIFTTMLTAMQGLCAWFSSLFGKGIYCPIVVLLAGFLLSRLGFSNVVSLLYPVIGVLGLFYVLLGLIFVLRNAPLPKPLYALFHHRNSHIHKGGKHTQNDCRGHN